MRCSRTQQVVAVRGFTLIELMIVVAVVAILAAIAYPSYQDQVRKSRRGQAKADLAELSQRYERWHTTNNTYIGFWASVPADQRRSPRQGATAHYAITANEAANAFTLTATPQGAQVNDTRCGSLGLNQAGVKTKTGSGTISDCW